MSLGADGFVVEGYVACSRCGEFTVVGKKSATCAECRAILAETARLIEDAQAIEGRPIASRPTRARRRRKLTAADRQRRRQWNAARSAALQRLARIYRSTYEVLLAEEKAKRGLDPGIDVRTPGAAPIERAILERATEDAA